MRIAIDGLVPVTGGGITYLRELVPELCSSSVENEFILFLRMDLAPLQLNFPPNCKCVFISLPQKFRTLWRIVWQQVMLPVILWRIEAEVLFCPYGIAPLAAPCRVVLGIQNASPYYGPIASTRLQRARNLLLVWFTWFSARKAEKVFFVSEWSRNVIGRSLGLSDKKCHVIHHGVSDRFSARGFPTLEPVGATRPYALVVGSVASHKDYLTLFEAWRVLQHCGRFDLIVAGPILDPAYYRRLNSMLSCLGLDANVVFLTLVPYEKLPGLYQRAAVLIMPTYVETFGLPMLEAMSCGIPVIASDIPVAHEVCGEAAHYYRNGDSTDLAEKLKLIMTDSPTRHSFARMGRLRASRFAWSSAAERTLQLLRGDAS